MAETEGIATAVEKLTESNEETTTVVSPAKKQSSRTPRTAAKRKENPENWKQNVRKRLRQAGLEYVNSSGNVVTKRSVHPGCNSTCHFRCNEKFDSDERQTIHNAFWKLNDEQKNYFYWKYTSRVQPKRRRSTSNSETSKRGCTIKYRFELQGELLPVCSKFFFATLDISARRISYFYKHCYDEVTRMPGRIKRGQGRKRSLPQLAERLDEVREHISAQLREENELQKDFNLTRSYKLYAESVDKPLKQHWYSKVYNEEFAAAKVAKRVQTKMSYAEEE